MVGQWVTIFVSVDLIKWLNQKKIGGSNSMYIGKSMFKS